MSSPNDAGSKGLSLLHKILLPFFLILTLLGAGATIVSVLLITEALSKTADDRLSAFEEVLSREIKKQESLLTSFANLLDDTEALRSGTQDFSIPPRLQAALTESKIVATIYPVDQLLVDAQDPLQGILAQAVRSGKPRLRLTAPADATPMLAVAAPLQRNGVTEALLLMQTPLDQYLLNKLSAPFRIKAYIYDSSGQVLAGSERNTEPPHPGSSELERLLSGHCTARTESTPFPRRLHFSALPLGTTDLILIGSELPMTDLRLLLKTLATGSVAAITAALLLGGYIYYRLIRQIMAPIHELLSATKAICRGDLDYRIENVTNDEFGHLAKAFNKMMGQVAILYNEKIEQERELTQAQNEIKYKAIVEQKNLQIEKTNLELQSHLNELSALFQLNQAMISTLDLQTLFDRILQVLKEVTHCDSAALLLYNPGAEELEVHQVLGPESDALRGSCLRLEEGVTGQAARNQELIYVQDINVDSRYLHYKGKTQQRGSMVSAPLASKKRLLGVLNLHKERCSAFTDGEIKLIQTVVTQASIAIENAQLYEKTRNLSNTDELTGLANRRHFQEIVNREVAQARRYGTGFSLIITDIDHFKLYNDSHGHLRGDAVLRKVAALLLQNTRGIDLVARFGGEEFVILLPKTGKEGARAAAEKLRQCVAAETFSGAERSQPGGRLTISLGVSEFPSNSRDIYELIDLADKALYHAKQNGRNRTVAWDDVLSQQLPEGTFPSPGSTSP